MKLLNKLKLDTYAKIVSIDCSGSDRRRFLDLGIINGTILRPVFRSPGKDPTAYEIRKSVIALRKEDAEKIKVIEM